MLNLQIKLKINFRNRIFNIQRLPEISEGTPNESLRQYDLTEFDKKSQGFKLIFKRISKIIQLEIKNTFRIYIKYKK